MSGTDLQVLTEPLSASLLSTLRHELVAPINLVVGYCELLMAEALDNHQTTWVEPLQSIRQLGFMLLESIDQTLLRETGPRSLVTLRELARGLILPATRVMEICDTLVESLSCHPDDFAAEFTVDLERIRLAGARMIAMARELIEDRLPAVE